MQNFLGSFQIWPKVLPKFSAKFPYVLRKFLDESFLFQNFQSLIVASKIWWESLDFVGFLDIVVSPSCAADIERRRWTNLVWQGVDLFDVDKL